jgi:hypothetical protein
MNVPSGLLLLVTSGVGVTTYLADLALIVGIAALLAAIFQRLRLPIVLGYLLAGLIVGPHVPTGCNVNPALAAPLSDIGVILLMFSLGLEFSIRRLIRIAPSGGLVALIECSLVAWLGYFSGRLLGWSKTESIFVGAICAISSTTIIAKTFAERGIRGRLSEVAFSVLVAEDLIAILLLAVLTAVTGGGAVSAGFLGRTTFLLLGFLAVMLVGGMLVVPRLIRLVVRLGRAEILVMACLGLGLHLCLSCAKSGLFGGLRGIPGRGTCGRVGGSQAGRTSGAADSRHLCRSVFRLDRHADRSGGHSRPRRIGADLGRGRRNGQSPGRRNRILCSWQWRATFHPSGHEPGPDRRVLVHPCWAGRLGGGAYAVSSSRSLSPFRPSLPC